MEIVRVIMDDGVELMIQGRLDSYWAEHLDRGLADTVREGHDRLRLDLSAVTFLSSAGIAVLMKYSKQLRAIEGLFVICSPSVQVRKVLDMTRLTQHLVEPPDARAARAPTRQEGVHLERDGARLELFDLAPGAVLRGGPLGGHNGMVPIRSSECGRPLRCPDSLFALGIGAIGTNLHDCRERFGEFLAVAGAVVYLPGDGTGVPDYLVAAGNAAPELQVLHGVTGEGQFARVLRFDPIDEQVFELAEVAAWCLELSGEKVAGLTIVAEAAGLVGASLRQQPAEASVTQDFFAYPALRNHLSFASERVFAGTTVVVVGFVSHDPLPELRSIGGRPDAYGHFHAAAFSFAPLKRGRLELKPLVAQVFGDQKILGVLHLLNDNRPAGAGQSELIRGACWFGPVRWEA